MTIRVGVTEARRRLSELVDRAAAGDEIVITKRGVPVARLIAVRQERQKRERT